MVVLLSAENIMPNFIFPVRGKKRSASARIGKFMNLMLGTSIDARPETCHKVVPTAVMSDARN